jgi:hypothetical protein
MTNLACFNKVLLAYRCGHFLLCSLCLLLCYMADLQSGNKRLYDSKVKIIWPITGHSLLNPDLTTTVQ